MNIIVILGELIQNFAHKQFVTCVQFHPNEPNLFLSGTSRNGIYCWDSRQQKVEEQPTNPATLYHSYDFNGLQKAVGFSG